jgi:hypothetical protein
MVPAPGYLKLSQLMLFTKIIVPCLQIIFRLKYLYNSLGLGDKSIEMFLRRAQQQAFSKGGFAFRV